MNQDGIPLSLGVVIAAAILGAFIVTGMVIFAVFSMI